MAFELGARLAPIALLVAGACGLGEEAAVVEINGAALAPVRLAGTFGGPTAERWDLVQRPSASQGDVLFSRNGGGSVLSPDARGLYVVERWLEIGVSAELTHQFIIDIPGAPGEPVLVAPERADVGATITIDGASSSSPEGLDLTYQWRLAERPRDSAATLESDVEAQTSFVADLPGDYVITLAVFDGALWSNEVSATIIAVD